MNNIDALIPTLNKIIEPVLNAISNGEIINRGPIARLVDTDSQKKYLKLEDKSYSLDSIPKNDVSQPMSSPNFNFSHYRYKLNTNLIYKHIEFDEIFSSIFGKTMPNSGFFYAPPGGCCPWHTNSEKEQMNMFTPEVGFPERIYLVWAKESDKSFFRYKDSETGDLVTKWDKKGWQVNRFTPGPTDKPFWHCVASETDRISIGFMNIENFSNDIKLQNRKNYYKEMRGRK